jgi:hypothetical protein
MNKQQELLTCLLYCSRTNDETSYIIMSVVNANVHSRMCQCVSDTSRDFTNGTDAELLVSL